MAKNKISKFLRKAFVVITGKNEASGITDDRVINREAQYERLPILYIVAGLVIILVLVPCLMLPSDFGKIPYHYSKEFLDAHWLFRYLIAYLGTAASNTAIIPVGDFPVPVYSGGIELRIILTIVFWALIVSGGFLLKIGKTKISENLNIYERKETKRVSKSKGKNEEKP